MGEWACKEFKKKFCNISMKKNKWQQETHSLGMYGLPGRPWHTRTPWRKYILYNALRQLAATYT